MAGGAEISVCAGHRTGGMVLTSSQHILLAVSLALCMCFLVPRMIGGPGEAGKKDPRRMATPFRGHSGNQGARTGCH